jgi:hypothetical protein
MKKREFNIVSYCDIPQELTEKSYLKEYTSDSYVEHVLTHEQKVDDDLDDWLRGKYPELAGTSFLIHLDY